MEGYKTTLNLDSEFPFGKYQGETVWDVLLKDAAYIVWFRDNVDSVILLDVDDVELTEVEELNFYDKQRDRGPGRYL